MPERKCKLKMRDALFDIIQRYFTLFDIILHYSTLFYIIQHYFTFFNIIQLFKRYLCHFQNETANLIRTNLVAKYQSESRILPSLICKLKRGEKGKPKKNRLQVLFRYCNSSCATKSKPFFYQVNN